MEIKIVICGQEPQKEYILMADEPIKFIDAMAQLGLSFYRPCGGIGKCLSCGIKFSYGAPSINSDDERALDFSDIRAGWRLGCKCTITRSCKIEVPASLSSEVTSVLDKEVPEDEDFDKDNIAIAVDVGTTTIATAVVDLSTGKILRQRNCTNSQIKYGSDVISRVKASMEGHDKELMDSVRGDLIALGREIIGEDYLMKRIVFSANTVMTHLFLGYTVDGLAKYPFVPYTLDSVKFVEKGRDIFFMPGISSFVGGDILSGLFYLNNLQKSRGTSSDKYLLVDLGTNAELVLYDGDTYWCSSASAGPALEGASLSCGVASVRGAINHLSINDSRCKYTTIGGDRPIGLCGSGVIDVVHELHRNHIIDDGGLLIDEYSEKGYQVADGVVITGEDIQQVLLAKAAIYSATSLLVKEAGITFDDIDHLYVSGGLGATVSVWAAAGIGLFPKELVDKFEAVGNTSLRGAIDFIMNTDEAALYDIKEHSKIVILNDNPEFESLFLDSLTIR
ncbi:MAG: ASKHA domain-containing protein [Pseudobutyrivibrio sp.]|nr:ASKHA domain-containing protein [Pseudobutyrivibrio sp.]